MTKKGAEQLFLSNQLCFSLYAASRLVTQQYAPYLAPLDLTYPQYLVLLVLWEKRRCTVSELGNELCLDSGTLSPLLKKLEQKGLIDRRRLKEDERSVSIEVTKAGTALRAKAESIPQKILCRSKMDLARAISLKRELDELRKNLQSGDETLPQ